MIISTKTKLTGLLGYPLGHSMSPVMQNAAFEYCSMNRIYIPVEVKPENLETVVRGISKMNFDGFNVTIPHKIEIMKYLDETDEYARCIGAVNTVKIKDGRLKGYNTDGIGFLRSFEENTGDRIEGKSVFVLGSGGASRAVSMTLALNKAKKMYICNRTFDKASSLADDIKRQTGIRCEAVSFDPEEIKKALQDTDVLINTTSVGMSPNMEESPLDKSLLDKRLTVCDIVYNPRKTRLLKDAEEKGCRIVEGLPMLVYQGAEAFEVWTDVKAPADVMFEAVEDF
ncbi:MAG: shikimate dehydrogenase [Sedimentibacter sp.]|uniref:shikimate dehydrogenase n=1 Tax=Sedimentibacter sp. TaxID=1960295 RepID=UPI00315905E7